jgi:2',3'-cyclic-nucleotide 2'-phosphodiesterase/3'-nucleotidase
MTALRLPALRPALLATLATVLLAAPVARAAELKLRLLETTDLHMNLLAWDYYQDRVADEFGLARTATLIKAARAEVKNSLLIDNGDLLQGSPLGDLVARIQPLPSGRVHPAYTVLNGLRVDAGNLGNHEFNYGLPFLRQAMAGAAFPIVNANVRLPAADDPAKGGAPAFTPYVILERTLIDEAGAPHPMKIGVIGFVPPQILVWDRAALAGRLVVDDIVATARRYVPQMRAEGAQVVVAVPHSGFERSETTPAGAENTVARLAEVPGIDAILFGHSHGEFPGRFFANHPKTDIARGTINGVPAVMPGFWGSHLGAVDLVLDDRSGRWVVTDGRGALRPVYDRATRQPLAAPDPQVAALVADEHAATLRYVRGEVATTTAAITSYFAQVVDDPSVQLVADAQRAYARRALQGTPYEGLPLLSAAAPFKSGGRMGWTNYTDIAAGTLSIRNVADLYVYPNTLKAVKLSGAQVREWLEMSAGAFRRIDPAGPPVQMLINDAYVPYNFDVIDGVSYRLDLTQPARYSPSGALADPAAHRVEELRFDGRPIDEAAAFIVVTNNYRASGGGGFPELDGRNIVLDAPDENREALLQHLRGLGRITPQADGNWAIQPVPGVSLRFQSASAAAAQLPRYPALRLVQDNGDGSATFELRP